jgi:8-oxo-dGTP pyrophosphatase MutT (NUDIX family)
MLSLAATLRKALDQGKRRSPILLEGDVLEGDVSRATPAAVLVPVVDQAEPAIILTERLATMRKHPGQISFPGGRIDPDDESPTAAALREAEEEIGLPRHLVEVIGIADRYRTITGFEITPVLGVVPPGLALTPHPGEVAAILQVPLAYLLDPRHQIVRSIEWEGSERCYYEIEWCGHRIWGATAAMIVNLSRRLEQAA